MHYRYLMNFEDLYIHTTTCMCECKYVCVCACVHTHAYTYTHLHLSCQSYFGVTQSSLYFSGYSMIKIQQIHSCMVSSIHMVRETGVQSQVKSYQRVKMVRDAALLNTQHYKVRIKGKGTIQGMELRSPLHLSVLSIKKGAFGSSSTKVANFT